MAWKQVLCLHYLVFTQSSVFFPSVSDTLIQYGLALHEDFMFSEPGGHVFLIYVSSPGTSVVRGSVPVAN